MAIDEGKIVEGLNLGRDVVKEPSDAYEEYVIELSKLFVEAFVEYMNSDDVSASGTLAQSVIAVPINGLVFEIQADEYYKFVDQGVNGTKRKYGSEFSFKHETASRSHAQQIKQWIPQRGLTKPSSIPTYDSFAYAIATSIKRKGIKPKNITENVITKKALQKIQDDLVEVSGVLVNLVFDKSATQINKLN